MNQATFDQAACGDRESSWRREWLCTNGLGGYAAGTMAGVNTRKYHGYLVTALRPPVERYVLLGRVEDKIQIGRDQYPLSTNEFPGVIEPQGYRNLIRFELRTGPVWRYQCGEAIIEKSVTLVYGQDTVIIRYELLHAPAASDMEVRLYVQPMLAGRHFHATAAGEERHVNWRREPSAPDAPLLLAAPQAPNRLYISHQADHFSDSPCWWYNYVYREETARGYLDRDDLWTPGTLVFILHPGRAAGFICSTNPVPWTEQAALLLRQQARQDELAARLDHVVPASHQPAAFAGITLHQAEPTPSTSGNGAGGRMAGEFISRLSLAADQFLVHRSAARPGRDKMSVIAGYPWFEDWGRDTFISLAGLTLVTGDHAAARNVLVTFAEHICDGLVPNRFPDLTDEPDYNTVDASLWLIHAAYQYWRYAGDAALLQDYLYAPLCQIIDCYRQGTRYGIRMRPDALIRAGEPGVQLTWMDAKIGDEVITPRHGLPVEINALWYNALCIMTHVAKGAGDTARAASYEALARTAAQSFTDKFWNAAGECLFDVLGDDGTPDARLRPNQILAIGLPFSPLPPARAAAVVATVEKHLLTPLGLRTLAPESPEYQGHYQGDQNTRDRAYHQGTVWPWLIGPFVTALVKVHGGTPQIRRRAWEILQPFEPHLREAGLGSISEIADGDAPHQPRGCTAQAWSVAEVLRCCWEDVLNRAPPWPHEGAA